MATIKKPDKDTRSDKNQPKPADDLSSMMAIDDEDLEILNMTERTLVGPVTDDEETIAINNKPNVSKKKKEGEEAAKTADMPYQFDELAGEPDDDEAMPEEVEADEEEEDISDAIELDEDEPELELEEEKPAPAPKTAKPAPAPKADKPSPVQKAEKAAPAKTEKPAPAPKAEKPAPVAKAEKPAPAPKPGKAAPGPKAGKAAPRPKPEKRAPEPEADEDKAKPKKNPYKIIALVSIPIFVALIVLVVLALRKQPQEIQVASSSDTASQTVEAPASIPAAAPQTVPAQPARPAAVPQTTATARPAPGIVPQPQGRPAATNLPTGAPGAQGAAAVNAAGQARPASPVTQPQTRVAAQPGTPAVPQPQVQVPPPQASQQSTPAAVPTEKIQPPAVPDKNAVHTLKGIDFTESGGTVQMKILLDNPAVEYKCFALSGPTRVVVDLMGKWNKPPFENKNVSNSRVSRIRIGKDADKVRIVADISGGEVAPPTAAAGPDGLVVNITGK